MKTLDEVTHLGSLGQERGQEPVNLFSLAQSLRRVQGAGTNNWNRKKSTLLSYRKYKLGSNSVATLYIGHYRNKLQRQSGRADIPQFEV